MKKILFRNKYALPILAVLFLGLVTVTAEAAPFLDYHFSGGGVYGEVDGSLFNEASFDVHIFGDADNVVNDFGFYENANLNANVTIFGGDLNPSPLIGDFLSDVYVFSDNGLVGFGTHDNETDQFYVFLQVALTYDLKTAFGPYSSDIVSIYNYVDADTTFGGLLFDTVNSATFEATEVAPVPIPPSVLLFGSGLIGMIGIRKKFLG